MAIEQNLSMSINPNNNVPVMALPEAVLNNEEAWLVLFKCWERKELIFQSFIAVRDKLELFKKFQTAPYMGNGKRNEVKYCTSIESII